VLLVVPQNGKLMLTDIAELDVKGAIVELKLLDKLLWFSSSLAHIASGLSMASNNLLKRKVADAKAHSC
jgi:hypothetical protein